MIEAARTLTAPAMRAIRLSAVSMASAFVLTLLGAGIAQASEIERPTPVTTISEDVNDWG
ncbi:hypothetical protein JCM13580A_62100 [Streptomyces drozdowiczii]